MSASEVTTLSADYWRHEADEADRRTRAADVTARTWDAAATTATTDEDRSYCQRTADHWRHEAETRSDLAERYRVAARLAED